MLFYLRANVTIKVKGISGSFQNTVGWLVNANEPNQAKQKFEEQVRKDFSHMQFEKAQFEYIEFAGEIK